MYTLLYKAITNKYVVLVAGLAIAAIIVFYKINTLQYTINSLTSKNLKLTSTNEQLVKDIKDFKKTNDQNIVELKSYSESIKSLEDYYSSNVESKDKQIQSLILTIKKLRMHRKIVFKDKIVLKDCTIKIKEIMETDNEEAILNIGH